MDHVLRARRLLLTARAFAVAALAAFAVAACSPARQQPVGASQGGAGEALHRVPPPPPAPPLAGVPLDFRTTWTPLGAVRRSEHGGGRYDEVVLANAAGAATWAQTGEPTVGSIFVAELLEPGDAGKTTAGLYLVERREDGYRFAAADAAGRTLTDAPGADAGAGTTVALCVRCHAESMRPPLFPLP